MCDKSETEAPATAVASCCGGTGAAAPATVTIGASPDADLAECPVMRGSMVNKADAEAAGLFRDYEGQRYWFCCAGCGPAWDADPAKYAAA